MRKIDVSLLGQIAHIPERYRHFVPKTREEALERIAATDREICEELRQEALKNEQGKESARIARGMKCVPEKYIDASFDKYLPETKSEENILDISKRFAGSFGDKARKTGAGLLFYGNTGTGKTLLSFAIFRSLLKNGFTVHYTKLKCLTDGVFGAFYDNGHGSVSAASIRKACHSPDFLIIYELGHAGASSGVSNELFDVLDERSSNNRPTLCISNLDREGVIESLSGGKGGARSLGEAAFGRIVNGGMALSFNGRDRRTTGRW